MNDILLLAEDELFKPQKLGGGGRYVKAMAKFIPIIAKKDIDIEFLKLPKIKIIPNSMQSLVRSVMDSYNSKIIHNLVGCVVPKRGRSRVITTAHEFREFTFSNSDLKHITFKEKLYYYFLKKSTRRILSSDFLISNSTQTKDEAIKLGFDKDRVFVVNHGVEDKFILNKPKQHKNKIFTVGYLDTLRPVKITIFIKALPTLYQIDKNVDIHIYGSGLNTYNFGIDELKILNSFIAKKFVTLKGFAPEQKIINIYDSFDAFVFPSLYEGFGLPILEAQARGLPVILYKYGKIPKEVRKYCFEAESPEHMAQIIENLKENGYNEKLRKKATEYARSFTWEKCARETLKVYKKVLN